MSMERNCTLLLHYDKSTPPNEEEIREDLESKDVERKVEGLRKRLAEAEECTREAEVIQRVDAQPIRMVVRGNACLAAW